MPERHEATQTMTANATTMPAATEYTTYGDVRGQGPVRATIDAAARDLRDDQAGCARQGGYSDRRIVAVSESGRLVEISDLETGEVSDTPVWPSHGRSSGSVRVVR